VGERQGPNADSQKIALYGFPQTMGSNPGILSEVCYHHSGCIQARWRADVMLGEVDAAVHRSIRYCPAQKKGAGHRCPAPASLN